MSAIKRMYGGPPARRFTAASHAAGALVSDAYNHRVLRFDLKL
jgi:hypothetical protein